VSSADEAIRAINPSCAIPRPVSASAWSRNWLTRRTAYAAELASPEALVAASIVFERRRSGPVTLLYAARDEHRNNAVALKLWLDQQAPAP
jgi:uncharacterized protein YeaO (DUF488 family)